MNFITLLPLEVRVISGIVSSGALGGTMFGMYKLNRAMSDRRQLFNINTIDYEVPDSSWECTRQKLISLRNYSKPNAHGTVTIRKTQWESG